MNKDKKDVQDEAVKVLKDKIQHLEVNIETWGNVVKEFQENVYSFNDKIRDAEKKVERLSEYLIGIGEPYKGMG